MYNLILTKLALQLYVTILTSSKNYDKALAILEGPLRHLCILETERIKMYTDVLSEMPNRMEQVVDLCEKLLLKNTDDWHLYVSCLSAVLKLNSKTAADSHFAFLKSVQETSSESSRPVRGPFLAELYYLRAFQIHEGYSAALLRYFTLFGTTLSCFDDLYPVLKHLSIEGAKDLSDDLAVLTVQENKINQTRMNINILKLNRYFHQGDLDLGLEISSLLQSYNISTTLRMLSII